MKIPRIDTILIKNNTKTNRNMRIPTDLNKPATLNFNLDYKNNTGNTIDISA